ncbi:MAG TPA: alpha/beta hydrolase [Acidothermaceae bacterium]
MTTFGLVHGAYHGAWCWAPTVAELERRGHRALTVDLPCEDPTAGAAAYAAVAVEAFASADNDLVLVGHSLGGLTIPLVAHARPVQRLVYLCAMLPRLDRTQDDVIEDEPEMLLPSSGGGPYRGDDGASHWNPQAAASRFFSDCEPAIATWAAEQLRGQFWAITQEVTPLLAWPDVPSSYILGTADPIVSPEWSRRVVPEVLGVQPIEIAAGHSPFLSVPVALVDALEG